jgi:hypothetical protein
MSTTEQLLSEFIDAWNAGRRPRVREYLARLPNGPERDALAEDLDRWLEFAPTPAYDEPARAAIVAEPAVARVRAAADADAGLWPELVPVLRERAGLSVAELAAQLVERCALDRRDTERTTGYLQRLERGGLDPARMSRRLTDALAGILGLAGDALADAGTYNRGLRPAAAAGGALFRAAPDAADLREDFELLARAARSPAPPPLDELDRLFTGGPDA